MSGQQIALVIVDDRAPQEKVVQEKAHRRSKKREVLSNTMSTLNEKFSRIRSTMIEFIEELDEVIGANNTT